MGVIFREKPSLRATQQNAAESRQRIGNAPATGWTILK